MKRRIIWGTVCCFTLGVSLVACVPQVEEDAATVEKQGTTASEVTEEVHQETGVENLYNSMSKLNEAYSPDVRTLEDGTQVQSAPDVDGVNPFKPSSSSYNEYFLNASSRGCVSCHTEGLEELVMNKIPYRHQDFLNGFGTEVKPMDCGICHKDVGSDFTSLIHGIHSKDSFKGDCMSCHTVSSDGQGLQLWEEAKYDILRGIKPLSDVEGTFSYDQDTTSEMFNLWWVTESSVPGTPFDHAFKNDPIDDETFNTWEITVSGEVENPYTITLGELVEEAPSETFISSVQCINNAPGGELVANVEVTGIPISWLIEKAGVKESATGFGSYDSLGYEYPTANSLESLDKEGGWLVYEINGERLSWNDGFPCRTWIPDHAVPASVRWVTDIKITDTPVEDMWLYEGHKLAADPEAEDGSPDRYGNKPNAGIMKTHEGQIIPVGESYEFQGYADAFDEQVVAMEFSLDRGKTWTRFDTSDSDKKKWVYWRYSFTPEEPGGYVLSVRSITDTGRVSLHPDEIMVIAK